MSNLEFSNFKNPDVKNRRKQEAPRANHASQSRMDPLLGKTMALSNGPSTLDTHVGIRRSGLEPQQESEDDLDKLESDLQKMAQKIIEYRTTLPDLLKATLVTVLSSQRPVMHGTELDSDPGPSGERNADSRQVESIRDASKHGEQKTSEKTILLKDKISSNIAAMPPVLKRLRECISRMEKLDSCNGIVHPAFKRRKNS